MTTLEWIKSNIDYGRSLIRSGLEGALAYAPVTSALINSVRDSWMPAVIGAYVGALGASLGHRRKAPLWCGTGEQACSERQYASARGWLGAPGTGQEAWLGARRKISTPHGIRAGWRRTRLTMRNPVGVCEIRRVTGLPRL